MTELDLFAAAVATPDPVARAALLDRECGGNPVLRARLDKLLAAHVAAHPLLGPTADGTVTHSPGNAMFAPDPTAATVDRPGKDETVGAILGGKYKLIEEIGEGGMGSVFMAQQTAPVKRAVAVKVIKAGMDSKAVLARFEAERQALAMMDHPNIARVLDAGTTESGRPYFVMELVKGVPITEYCDERKLTPRQRLELFVPVCNAIQHAHQKGVIHRDIKPSNVLVALYDDRPVPKVIDFGVAKAAGQTLTDKTLMTGFGAVVGTPEYMSPEQANLNNLDIDTRSDVYSLGVLLYELLTGSTPVDRKSLGKAALLEILRIVREVEAPRPSAKLSTIDTLPSVAANRGTEPAKLAKLMKGELDWVLLKALEKDRTRRYDTANGLARDIQRYLADEIVEARPPSTGYRVRKFVKRHKGQVIAASLVLLALLGGIAGTTWGLIRAYRSAEAERSAKAEVEEGKSLAEKKNAELSYQVGRADAAVAAATAEKTRAEDGERKAVAAQARADREANVARGLNDFFLFGLLRLTDAKNQIESDLPNDPDIKLRDVLDRAAEKLDLRYRDQPLTEAAIRLTLSSTYQTVGNKEAALSNLVRAVELREAHLGPSDPETVAAMAQLWMHYVYADRKADALPLIDRVRGAIAADDRPIRPEHLDSAGVVAWGYSHVDRHAQAIALCERVRDATVAARGAGQPETLQLQISLAHMYHRAGRRGDAEKLLDAVAATVGPLRPGDRSNHSLLNNVGNAYRSIAPAKAVRVFEALAKQYPGENQNLLYAYMDAGRFADAIPLLEANVARNQSRDGEKLTRTAQSDLGLLAVCYNRAGRPADAVRVYEQVVAKVGAMYGAAHEETVGRLFLLGQFYMRAGRPADAATTLTAWLRGAAPDPKNWENQRTAREVRAKAYEALDRYPDAVADWDAAVELTPADARPLYRAFRASASVRMGRVAAGLKEADEIAAAAEYEPRVNVYNAACIYAVAAGRGGDNADGYALKAVEYLRKAVPLGYRAAVETAIDDDLDALRGRADFRGVLAEMVAKPGSDDYSRALAVLAGKLLGGDRFADAEAVARECLALREKSQPDVWSTFNTRCMLGGALLGQKKYAEAEPLLLNGYEGMKAREKAIPPQGNTRIPEALDRLIDLYTATKKPDEVKKYQKLRAKYPTAKEVLPPPRADK